VLAIDIETTHRAAFIPLIFPKAFPYWGPSGFSTLDNQFSQATIAEPATLGILGANLLGFGGVYCRRFNRIQTQNNVLLTLLNWRKTDICILRGHEERLSTNCHF
jgi:hypothetical protein